MTESAVEGKKTESTRTISEEDRKTITNVVENIKNKFTHHFSSHEIETFENNDPLTVIKQRFCHSADFVLIFEVSGTIHVLSFRSSLADGSLTFLGKFSFAKDKSMTEQEIITKATAVRLSFDSEAAFGAITTKNTDYTGLKAQSEEAVQLGDFLRITYVVDKDGYLNRFLVSGSAAGQYEVIEECRLEKVKETHTETKVTVTGETLISTNDVEKVVKEDKTAKEVIESIKREVTELKESTPVNVQMADYEKKAEYIVCFETKGDDTKETKIEEVLVVHDKVTHHTEIIAVDSVVTL